MAKMEYRNIIVIGPTSTGKSTIASKIVKSDESYPHQPKETTMRSKDKVISDQLYKITVIDTTGFSTAATSRQRGNHLKEYLRSHNIGNIHLVIFVIRAGRLTGEDKRILESIAAVFKHPQLSSISALFITHCEQYNNNKRQDVIAEFRRERYTNSISKLMQRGILTTGFAAADDYDQGLLSTLEADNNIDLDNIDKIIAEADHGIEVTALFRPTLLEVFFKNCIIL